MQLVRFFLARSVSLILVDRRRLGLNEVSTNALINSLNS